MTRYQTKFKPYREKDQLDDNKVCITMTSKVILLLIVTRLKRVRKDQKTEKTQV